MTKYCNTVLHKVTHELLNVVNSGWHMTKCVVKTLILFIPLKLFQQDSVGNVSF